MRIRSDFVTNSSSANFIVEIEFTSNENISEKMSYGVSPECYDVMAEYIDLTPDEDCNGDITFESESIYTATTLEELCKILGDHTLIEAFEEERDYYDEDDEVEPIDTNLNAVDSSIMENFKNKCIEKGISLENLKEITINNYKSGNGDSCMYVNANVFKEYKDNYLQADDKDKVIKDFISFVRTEPVLPVEDNEEILPSTMPCIWIANDRDLAKDFKKYVECDDAYWVAEHYQTYYLDFVGKTIKHKDILVISEEL